MMNVLMVALAVFFTSGILKAQANPCFGINVSGGPEWPGGKYGPEKAVDCDPKTYWAGDPMADAWQLILDMGEVTELKCVTVTYCSSSHLPKTALFQISADREKWEEIGALPTRTPASLSIDRKTRYVKIDMQGKAFGKQPAIYEIAFNTKSDQQAGNVAQSSSPAVSNSGVSGWPTGVEEIRYQNALDKTQQPALFYNPKLDKPVPLLVALHTWSGGYQQSESGQATYAKWCIKEGWAMVHPHFRGSNKTSLSCGSELAIQDILDVVEYAKKAVSIDPDRIYLVGVSGGGHMALLMAGRAPQIWAGVSAWCGIYDLAAWHAESRAKKAVYATMLEDVCGGAPGDSPSVDQEYRQRSPAVCLANAQKVPLDINAGITDGHTGSVPVSHSLRAFNAIAALENQILEVEIASIIAQPKIPEGMRQTIEDPLYRSNPILYRRVSGNVRVTLFQGGHQIIHDAALTWLSYQRRGTPANWGLLSSGTQSAAKDAVEAGK
jgi:acetyl esterase/lipase